MNSVKIHSESAELPVGKILCLGRNYVEHAKEMRSEISQTPVVFLKPSTALVTDGRPIVIPHISNDVHHEVELVVAIAGGGKCIPATKALEHVLGYAVGLDMTLRDVQAEAKKQGLPWSIAKGFDTSAPVSEIIPRKDIPNPQDLTLRCSVNGTVRQQASTSMMIFPWRRSSNIFPPS